MVLSVVVTLLFGVGLLTSWLLKEGQLQRVGMFPILSILAIFPSQSQADTVDLSGPDSSAR